MASLKLKLPSLPPPDGKGAAEELPRHSGAGEYSVSAAQRSTALVDSFLQGEQRESNDRTSLSLRSSLSLKRHGLSTRPLTAGGLLESLSQEEQSGARGADFRSSLSLKPHSASRPLWVCPDGRIVLEADSPVYAQALDLLVAISEPVSRTRHMQEYQLTQYSLYAGASMGLRTADILAGLDRFSKCALPAEIHTMVAECTERYGKVKLILRNDRYYIECPGDGAAFDALLHDPQIAEMRVLRDAAEEIPEHLRIHDAGGEGEAGAEGDASGERARDTVSSIMGAAAFDEDDPTFTRLEHRSFEVDPAKIKLVKERCNEIDWPLLEEYDFRNDHESPQLPIELRPETRVREYQQAALGRMFGSHRARSGIIVLPCGAGKTLVGITATTTIGRSCLVLCNSAVSVEQWYQQFLLWTTIPKDRIVRFTAATKEKPHPEACVVVSTYNMISFAGRRSKEAMEVMADVETREWGLLLMDEVHVVPANTFLTCTVKTKSRCKLGLTATLVREDDKIGDLNFLIGPKLYEANWLDLQAKGYIATVSCAEVWCPMTAEFFAEYLRQPIPTGRLLYAMNPNKFRSCEYLMRFHEARGDKIIVFSDNVFALKAYAVKLRRPYIYGPTPQHERMLWLNKFKSTSDYNTLFISKVGDTSIDLPEANVIIQIASHFGARRQEAQRLGRILRPKCRAGDSFNAFFYTLISRDTQVKASPCPRPRPLHRSIDLSMRCTWSVRTFITPALQCRPPSIP